LLGVTALAVVVVGSLVVTARQSSRALAATRAYAKLEKMVDTPLTPEGAGTAASPEGAGSGPKFRTENERREAVTREVAAFVASYGNTSLAINAQLVTARWTAESNPAEAVAVYEKMLQSHALNPSLTFLAVEGLGYAYEAKGDLDKATESYRRLADEKGELGEAAFRDRGLFDQARIAEKKGDKAGAAKLYHELLDKVPTSPLKKDATDRLATVEAK
jgi:tetratricopeptide (TPR) repeat protein